MSDKKLILAMLRVMEMLPRDRWAKSVRVVSTGHCTLCGDACLWVTDSPLQCAITFATPSAAIVEVDPDAYGDSWDWVSAMQSADVRTTSELQACPWQHVLELAATGGSLSVRCGCRRFTVDARTLADAVTRNVTRVQLS